jgi:putative phage-type endonuclease
MEQRSPEWYAARLGVLTASACEYIMTPAQRKGFVNKMIAEIVTGQPEPFPTNEYMQWGIDTEDEARLYYESKTGNKVRQVGFVYKDESEKVGCSPDGLVDKGGLIEIKCPMSKTHIGYMLDGPPKKYYMQMQFQMYVTNRLWCDFMSFDPRLPEEMKSYIVRIDRDPETIFKIEASIKSTIKEIDTFLADHGHSWKQTKG